MPLSVVDTKKNELPDFEKSASYRDFMVATNSFQLPFFQKSIGNDSSGATTEAQKTLENFPGFLSL